ncbi:MAG TPA: type II secretion system F family protein [Syntrophomonas sp.]|nr:type II secretion system F family protein [Syntrophomonas sp.]
MRDQQGALRNGELEAENRDLIVQKLLSQGLYILSLEEKKESKSIELSFLSPRVKTEDLVVFTRQLATMLAAGLSILRSFSILGAQTQNKTLQTAISQINDDIEAGATLWEAMDKHPQIFSGVYISMIRAGELGGVLDVVLERLGGHLERDAEITAKVKSASIYPAIIAIFTVVMVFGIITLVMPTFTVMFTAAGVELPAPTRILLAMGLFLKKYYWLVILLSVGLVFALKKWGTTAAGRYFFDNLYLRIPVLGKTVSRIVVSRFARTMGTLVRSGIPVLQALEAVEEVVGNAVISRAIQKARASIREGDTITGPLAAAGVFEPMVTQMIAVGEETGSLDEMLTRMSDYYDREVMYSIDALTSMIEPLLVVVVAVLVGGVVIATLLPIFDMVNLVG